MRTIPYILAVAAALVGCGEAADRSGQASRAAVSPQATATPAAPSPAPSAAAKAGVSTEQTDAYAFGYTYPAAAAAIEPLRAWLDSDRDAQRAAFARDAAAAKRESADDAFPFHRHELEVEWRVVTDTPRFLSLSQTLYQFTGGAHGMTGFDSVVWDREREARIAPGDVFVSPDALHMAVRPAFCRAVEKARADRRPEPLPDPLPEFTQCPDIAETTLILGSRNRRAIDRIGFLIGPYVAGPYAEGTYDLTIPVTPAILNAVRPEYRSAFVAR